MIIFHWLIYNIPESVQGEEGNIRAMAGGRGREELKVRKRGKYSEVRERRERGDGDERKRRNLEEVHSP